ncbi:hypothetical protein H4219_005003 [Mycoemilia scoparia]|uniref:Uncharacterized protein n=1 Tax=Mycoemilia scoparia TaxID=417184 RepID=A0A9W7ZXU7_9FUNG|nr:hypothetical protein H4219_005003 [Mycoemilia scoparia]
MKKSTATTTTPRRSSDQSIELVMTNVQNSDIPAVSSPSSQEQSHPVAICPTETTITTQSKQKDLDSKAVATGNTFYDPESPCASPVPTHRQIPMPLSFGDIKIFENDQNKADDDSDKNDDREYDDEVPPLDETPSSDRTFHQPQAEAIQRSISLPIQPSIPMNESPGGLIPLPTFVPSISQGIHGGFFNYSPPMPNSLVLGNHVHRPSRSAPIGFPFPGSGGLGQLPPLMPSHKKPMTRPVIEIPEQVQIEVCGVGIIGFRTRQFARYLAENESLNRFFGGSSDAEAAVSATFIYDLKNKPPNLLDMFFKLDDNASGYCEIEMAYQDQYKVYNAFVNACMNDLEYPQQTKRDVYDSIDRIPSSSLSKIKPTYYSIMICKNSNHHDCDFSNDDNFDDDEVLFSPTMCSHEYFYFLAHVLYLSAYCSDSSPKRLYGQLRELCAQAKNAHCQHNICFDMLMGFKWICPYCRDSLSPNATAAGVNKMEKTGMPLQMCQFCNRAIFDCKVFQNELDDGDHDSGLPIELPALLMKTS